MVDLDAGTCSCENRHPTECRHMRSAALAAEKLVLVSAADRRKALMDATWAALALDFGEPAEKLRTAFGRIRGIVYDQLVADDGQDQTPEAFAAEVKRRYTALVTDWGLGKVTLNSFGTNWVIAGKLADNLRAGPTSRGDDDNMTAEDMALEAMRDEAAGR